jgi:hypothetical protein
LDTYKFYRSILPNSLEEIRDTFLKHPVINEPYTKYQGEKEEELHFSLTRKLKDPHITNDILFVKMEFAKVFWGYDPEDNSKKPYILKPETEFAYFKFENNYYLIQFPKINGRREIKWVFNNLFEGKRPILKELQFPNTIIETFKKIHKDAISHLLELPQGTPHMRNIRMIGDGVDEDELYKAARKRGSEPRIGILLLPSAGWQIRINPKGTILCYQDPYSETFLNFIRKQIMPLTQ